MAGLCKLSSPASHPLCNKLVVQPQHGKQALCCEVKQVCRQGQRKWSIADWGRDEVDCSSAGKIGSNAAGPSTVGCFSNTQKSVPLLVQMT